MRYGAANVTTCTSSALEWLTGVSTQSQSKVSQKHSQLNAAATTEAINVIVILMSQGI